MLPAQGKHLFQHGALVLQKIKAVEPLAQVQVGQMKKTHGTTSLKMQKEMGFPDRLSARAFPRS